MLHNGSIEQGIPVQYHQ